VRRPIVAVVLCALMAACTQAPTSNADANTPGFTGRTIIPGNSSTIGGDAEETYLQQKWGMCLGD
jgi:hypothetical protein